MNIYKSAVIGWLKQKNVKFDDDGKNALFITYQVDNAGSIRTIIIFDDNLDGNEVCMVAAPCGKSFTENNYLKGLEVCDKMNGNYRWLKFFLNNEKSVVVQLDALLNLNDCGQMFMEYLTKVINIADIAYPEFMRALWA